MDIYLGLTITALLSSGAGAYIGAYLKKKGENLATHEDIEKLVRQMAAVTQATKEIEAKISNDMWDRQKRWELKREALFGLAEGLGAMENALSSVYSMVRASKIPGPEGQGAKALLSEPLDSWTQACGRFQTAHIQASLVCEKNVHEAINRANLLMLHTYCEVLNGDLTTLDWEKLVAAKLNLFAAIRAELHINESINTLIPVNLP